MSCRLHGSVPRKNRSCGFTLIELVIVIGLVLLIIGITAPALTGLSKGNNLSSGGRVVSNLMAVARSEAINKRRLTQLRVATKWMNASGAEDPNSSYRKFSVWQKPLPGDAIQAPNPAADPYVQISNWDTLPSGVTFEQSTTSYTFAVAGDPKNPGTYFLTNTLNAAKTGVTIPAGTADVAWIEFDPTGAVSYTGATPARIYILVTEGSWDGTKIISTQPNHANWLAATVDTLVGRINILRP